MGSQAGTGVLCAVPKYESSTSCTNVEYRGGGTSVRSGNGLGQVRSRHGEHARSARLMVVKKFQWLRSAIGVALA